MPGLRIPPPKEVFIPVTQHIGPETPIVVKVGDEVKVGQVIADSDCLFSPPIHASVSGKVTKIDTYRRSNGVRSAVVRIESDGLMTPFEGLVPPEITDLDSLISAIHKSGVVGLGGAGFPTAKKIEGAKGHAVHTIILNGAECEPHITSDARTMLDSADLIYEGVKLLKRVLPEINFIIGIEENKPECIAKMNEVFSGEAFVSVKVLPSRYPQGAEKVLIKNTTGITVPFGKLPIDKGIIVMNVTTLASIAKYVKTGMPLVERCVTVDGSAINEPKNVIVPIGTSIGDAVEAAGGFKEDLGKVVIGGPMMGFAAHSLWEPVMKTTGSIIAFTRSTSVHLKTTACVHCGKCVDACPHLLTPTAFTKALDIEDENERMARLEELGVTICIECGCCSFVCPANRPLMENNRTAKNALRSYKASKKDLK